MSTNERARGRSPELQQLLDEAAVAPVLPVQRMLPGRPAARAVESRSRAVPEQRQATHTAPMTVSASSSSDQPVAAADRKAGRPLARDGQPAVAGGGRAPAADPEPSRVLGRRRSLRSPDLPRRHSSDQHTIRPLRLRVLTQRMTRRPSRAASPHVIDKPSVVRLAGGRAASLRTKAGKPRPRTRRTLNLHTLNLRTTRHHIADPVSFERHEVPTTPMDSDFVPRTVAPMAVTAPQPPPLSYPIRVARAAILAEADDQSPGRHLAARRAHRRRAVLLAGGVAAAVIAIMAVVVFAANQRSGTSPGAEGAGSGAGTSTSTRTTAESPTVAAADKPPVKVTTSGPVRAVRPAAGAGAAGAPTARTRSAAAPDSAVTDQARRTAAETPAAPARLSTGTTATASSAAAPQGGDTQPAPSGDGGTATVVPGTSKLTGWVVISSTPGR